MHLIKGKKQDYGSIKDEAILRKNSKIGTIDPERSHLNYNLCPNLTPAPEELDDRIRELGVTRKIQTDAVRFCSVIVDLPKDETGPQEKFFKDAYDGLVSFFKIPEEAVLYAQVHLDEGHPHMHFCFAPIREYEKTYKDGHTKLQRSLSAKALITKDVLERLHPTMQTYMDDQGHDGTLWRNDDVKRDKSFLEHKEAQIEKHIEGLNQEYESKNAWLEKMNREYESLRAAQKDLQDELSVQKATVEAQKAEIERLEAEIQNRISLRDRVNAAVHTLQDKWSKLTAAVAAVKEELISAKKQVFVAQEPENARNRTSKTLSMLPRKVAAQFVAVWNSLDTEYPTYALTMPDNSEQILAEVFEPAKRYDWPEFWDRVDRHFTHGEKELISRALGGTLNATDEDILRAMAAAREQIGEHPLPVYEYEPERDFEADLEEEQEFNPFA